MRRRNFQSIINVDTVPIIITIMVIIIFSWQRRVGCTNQVCLVREVNFCLSGLLPLIDILPFFLFSIIFSSYRHIAYFLLNIVFLSYNYIYISHTYIVIFPFFFLVSSSHLIEILPIFFLISSSFLNMLHCFLLSIIFSTCQ